MSNLSSVLHRNDLDYLVSRYALAEALQAVSESSYGVGGVMINLSTKDIIKTLHNTVIARENSNEIPRLKDPTAHGERQLVDWYFANKATLKLPEPSEILIITTLDPCCMCTGSILAAGFKVIVMAMDSLAGINWNSENTFEPFENELSALIKSSFIYPAVQENNERTGFGDVPLFNTKTVESETISNCTKAFEEGAKKARTIIHDIAGLADAKDPSLAPVEYKNALLAVYPDALKYCAKEPGVPDEGLADILIGVANKDRENGGDGDAVAFLDCFGHLLMCKGGMKSISPIRTAYMETIRAYQAVRYSLSNENKEALKYFCEPKFGTFVFVKGFDTSAASFADLGAYGSTILGNVDNPNNLQYVLPRITQEALDTHISRMPPRYRQLIRPKQVQDKALIEKVRSGCVC